MAFTRIPPDTVIDAVRKNASLFSMSDAGKDVQKFADTLNEFFDESVGEIVASHMNKRKSNITIIVMDTDQSDFFRVIRFFPMNNEWVGSVDAEGPAIKVMAKMLELQERFI